MFLVVLIPSLIWILFYDDVRYLLFKALSMLSVIYLSSKFPRQLLFLLGFIALTGFVLDDVQNHIFISKHVGQNQNQVLTIPFLLICVTFFLTKDITDKYIIILYLVATLEFFMGLYFGVRNSCVIAMIFIMVLASRKIAKLFVKYGSLIPLIYILSLFISYKYYLTIDVDPLNINPSNIERSSMIYASLDSFFSYLLQGPGSNFDALASQAMTSVSSNLKIYSNEYGVDPHVFLLSLWRSVGSLITILWFIYWLYYWSLLRKIEPFIDDFKVRLYLALLAMAVVVFSLEPPSLAFRILVAVIMGVALSQIKTAAMKFNKYEVKEV